MESSIDSKPLGFFRNPQQRVRTRQGLGLPALAAVLQETPGALIHALLHLLVFLGCGRINDRVGRGIRCRARGEPGRSDQQGGEEEETKRLGGDDEDGFHEKGEGSGSWIDPMP